MKGWVESSCFLHRMSRSASARAGTSTWVPVASGATLRRAP
jgi:hypothetical protein